ncbi:MAG: hypothetical protein HZA90_09515 [Verrucomicrobia bacterium]|nr:hypothetical protein [Verrucomicrobiota bacterium]
MQPWIRPAPPKIFFRSLPGLCFREEPMGDSPIMPRHAWLPITPRGVAAFAAAPLGHLGLAQLIVAAFVAAVAACFVEANWFPAVRDAVSRLPETNAVIRAGALQWTLPTPARLGENRFLSLVVDANDTGELGRAADVEIALHRTHFTVSSLLGFVAFPYPRAWTVNLARPEAMPWWGAWEWPILALGMATVVVVLFVSWFVLATLYFPVVKAFAFFANRQLGWRGSWKLSSAALMPGALVVALGILCYGWLGMDLIQLGLFYAMHFLAGWVFIAVSPFFLPQDPGASALPANPFATPEDSGKPSKRKPPNPFSASH